MGTRFRESRCGLDEEMTEVQGVFTRRGRGREGEAGVASARWAEGGTAQLLFKTIALKTAVRKIRF